MHANPIQTSPLIRPLASAVAVLTLLGGMAGAPARAEEADADNTSATEAADGRGSKSDFRGVDLGEYLVHTYYPVEAQKSVVSFKLFATVKKEDAAEFNRLLKHRLNKVRDQVIIATRLVPVADFNDPELASLRRRILLRLRRTLPELAIQDAYLGDFELTVEAS
jgi:hypothetical protein